MHTSVDAKTMAKALRSSMARRQVELSHSECLEIVAGQFGFENWNILSAKLNEQKTRQNSNDTPVQMKDAIPILRIFSIEKAKEFYVDFLGFSIDWEHRFTEGAPLYMQVSRSTVRLHLSEHHGDANPGSAVFVWMSGIMDFHRELQAKNYRFNRPGLDDVPWDARAVNVIDPFGNRVLFNEPNQPNDLRA